MEVLNELAEEDHGIYVLQIIMFVALLVAR